MTSLMWHLCLLAHKRLRWRKRFGERDVKAVKKRGEGRKGGGGVGCGLGGCSGTSLAGWSGRLEPGRLHGVDGKSDDAEKNVSTPAARHVCFCPVIPLEQRVHLRPQSMAQGRGGREL